MNGITTGRQWATGIAAFLVTALLLVANAPQPEGSDLRLVRTEMAAR